MVSEQCEDATGATNVLGKHGLWCCRWTSRETPIPATGSGLPQTTTQRWSLDSGVVNGQRSESEVRDGRRVGDERLSLDVWLGGTAVRTYTLTLLSDR